MERSNNVSQFLSVLLSHPFAHVGVTSALHIRFTLGTGRLTGLLSFMLSDEMTTGSVTSTDRDKRILASRSHEWNRKQKRFLEAFPEVSCLMLVSAI